MDYFLVLILFMQIVDSSETSVLSQLINEINPFQAVIIGDNVAYDEVSELKSSIWLQGFDWHSALDPTLNREFKNALVILISSHNDKIEDMFQTLSQSELSSNVWFVISEAGNSTEMFDFASKSNPGQKEFNLQAQIYVLNYANLAITEVFGNAQEDLTFEVSPSTNCKLFIMSMISCQICGRLGKDCDIVKRIQDRKQRLNFHNQNVKVSCETWKPYSYWNGTAGSCYGIVPDAFMASN